MFYKSSFYKSSPCFTNPCFHKSRPVHVLQIHVLQVQTMFCKSSLCFTNPIQSMFYKSNPVHVLQYAFYKYSCAVFVVCYDLIYLFIYFLRKSSACHVIQCRIGADGADGTRAFPLVESSIRVVLFRFSQLHCGLSSTA